MATRSLLIMVQELWTSGVLAVIASAVRISWPSYVTPESELDWKTRGSIKRLQCVSLPLGSRDGGKAKLILLDCGGPGVLRVTIHIHIIGCGCIVLHLYLVHDVQDTDVCQEEVWYPGSLLG